MSTTEDSRNSTVGDGKRDSNICPFCKSADYCEHVLLVADITFRVVEGGFLSDAFEERLYKTRAKNEENPNYCEDDAFDELLSEVRLLADASTHYDHDSPMPGLSSGYENYFVSSLVRGLIVLKDFCAASD